MATKTLSACPVCGFPISAEYAGQTVVCADCGTNLIAQDDEGVVIPKVLFWSLLSFGLGMFIGPALVATTKGGQEWLVKQARRG